MTKEALAMEANQLSERLTTAMFDAAAVGRTDAVERLGRLIEKANERYERRWQAWQAELQDNEQQQ